MDNAIKAYIFSENVKNLQRFLGFNNEQMADIFGISYEAFKLVKNPREDNMANGPSQHHTESLSEYTGIPSNLLTTFIFKETDLIEISNKAISLVNDPELLLTFVFDKNIKSDFFQNAVAFLNYKDIKNENFGLYRNFNNIVDCFIDSYYKDGVEEGLVNFINCFVFLYGYLSSSEYDSTLANKLLNNSHSLEEKLLFKNLKESLVSGYYDIFDKACADLYKTKYVDYADWISCLKCMIPIYGKDSAVNDVDSMRKNGAFLFNILVKRKNKYALKLTK